MYLDTDIIIKGSLNLIFNIIKTDVLYALKEGFINEDDDAHGKSLFGDELQNYEDKSAFTSGILLFNNCPSIKQLFYDIKKDMEIRTHFFYDQPFIIYNAFKYNLYNNIIIGLYCINNNNNIDSDKIIHHFPSGPGCCDDKLATMVKFLNNQTLMAVYTCPASKTCYMRDWYSSASGAKKTSIHQIKLRARGYKVDSLELNVQDEAPTQEDSQDQQESFE